MERPSVIQALSVLLAELEDSIAHDDPIAYVATEAAVARLTTDCEEPSLRRLEYAPHHVAYAVNAEGELETEGHNDLLDAEWDETDSFWCRSCDTELKGELVAKAHVAGIDLTGLAEGEPC